MVDDSLIRRELRRTWLGLLGLLMPLGVVWLLVWPAVRAEDERADWVRVVGTAGPEVDLDHRMVTYTLPGDPEATTSEVPVMRTVEEGERIDLYHPPGRPELIEQDRSGFVLPYVVFTGFALLATCAVLANVVRGRRRIRRYLRLVADVEPAEGYAHAWSRADGLNRVCVVDVFAAQPLQSGLAPTGIPDLRITPSISALAGLEGVFPCRFRHRDGQREVVVEARDGTLAACGVTERGLLAGRRGESRGRRDVVLAPRPGGPQHPDLPRSPAEMSGPEAMEVVKGLAFCCIGLVLCGGVLGRGLGSGDWHVGLAVFGGVWLLGSLVSLRNVLRPSVRWAVVGQEKEVVPPLAARVEEALGWPVPLGAIARGALIVAFAAPFGLAFWG